MLKPSTDPGLPNLRNLSRDDLIAIIRKQREQYGDALLKIARIARRSSNHNLADVALSLREVYGLGDPDEAEARRRPTGGTNRN